MMAATGYAKGSVLGYADAWYHGDLTRDQAEQALRASSSDCFLIREQNSDLILSLTRHGQFSHIRINYGPGWFELETNSPQYSFMELEELVSHYKSNATCECNSRLTLGEVCRRISTKTWIAGVDSHDYYNYMYDYIFEPCLWPFHRNGQGAYCKGNPADLTTRNWFHGSISEEQANTALSTSNHNKFLVRQSNHSLILSNKINGWKSHSIIHHSPEGYRLEGKERVFKTVPEMIAHYQKFPISNRNLQVLGTPIDKAASGLNLKAKTTSTAVFKKWSDSLLRVSWRRCSDLPVAVSTSPIVKIGDNVYVGDGLRRANDEFTIFKYSLSLDTWTRLPPCPTNQHALATLNDELIVIGGKASGVTTGAVYTFQDDTWREVLPPMPTPRYLLSAVSYQDRLIVAAGGTVGRRSNGECLRTDLVEVYITSRQAWYRTRPLPFPMSSFSASIVGNTCCILGGVGGSFGKSRTTMYATISSLMESAVPADGSSPPFSSQSREWDTLKQKHPLLQPSVLEVDGRFTALGGSSEFEVRRGTKFISTYDFAADAWVECRGAKLPVALYRPGVVKLDHRKIMIIGGQPKLQHFSQAVFIGCFCRPRNVPV